MAFSALTVSTWADLHDWVRRHVARTDELDGEVPVLYPRNAPQPAPLVTDIPTRGLLRRPVAEFADSELHAQFTFEGATRRERAWVRLAVRGPVSALHPQDPAVETFAAALRELGFEEQGHEHIRDWYPEDADSCAATTVAVFRDVFRLTDPGCIELESSGA